MLNHLMPFISALLCVSANSAFRFLGFVARVINRTVRSKQETISTQLTVRQKQSIAGDWGEGLLLVRAARGLGFGVVSRPLKRISPLGPALLAGVG